jgi:excisionase family DNA binding protein
LLTPDDLAKRLGCSRLYIIRQAHLGKIPALKFGKSWRFLPTSIDAWLVKEERKTA